MGGNSEGYIYDYFTIGDKTTETPVQVFIGSPDGDEDVTLNDCTEICKYVNGKIGNIRVDSETISDVNYAAAAYCDGDDAITLNDCTEICKYVNGKSPTYVGTTVDLGTYATVAE